MSNKTVPVHAAIARAVSQCGIDTLFGLMGDSNLFMVDNFVRHQKGRYVPAVHEAGAVLMALGHSAMTNSVSAVTVTQGPAVSNAITPLIEGTKGMHPIVLLCGDTSVADPEHPQAVAQRPLIEATGAGFQQLRSPGTVFDDVATAFRRATIERRPIVLNMPTEMMWEMTADVGIPPMPLQSAKAPAHGDAIDEAVGMIASARCPLVLAGLGGVGARDALIRLANRIGAPLATTLKAKSLFEGEAYNLGVFGTLSTPAAAEVISSADCIIAFGAGLNRFTTARSSYVENRRLIQIDEVATQLGRRERPDAAISGDPALVVDILIDWLDEAEIPSSKATDGLVGKNFSDPAPVNNAENKPGTIGLTHALTQIGKALPEDKILVTDGGRFLNEAWTRIDVSGPQNMLLSINTGAIGLGFGYAVGAGVARPDQPVLLVTGDGGFMMGGLTEFNSAVRENLNMVIVVCNDSAYGAEYVQFEDRQMDPSLSLFNWPSLADAAGGLGGTGVQVTSEEELVQAIAEIERRNGPMLIELILDPATVPRLHL